MARQGQQAVFNPMNSACCNGAVAGDPSGNLPAKQLRTRGAVVLRLAFSASLSNTGGTAPRVPLATNNGKDKNL